MAKQKPKMPNAEERSGTRDEVAGPILEQQDWDALQGGEVVTDAGRNGDLKQEPETQAGDHPEEEDDNPYQESDEALPNAKEEAAIDRDPSKEGSRFDEVLPRRRRS
jgi:hypothetical protein